MKDFNELARGRYSCRSFTDVPVEKEKINKILESAKLAPTAVNKQPEYIYCLESKEALEKLQKCKHSHFNETLAFIVCYKEDECWIRPADQKKSGEIDASIVATHMMLSAYDLGIGSTWVMNYLPDELVKEFDIPSNIVPVCILVMGYPSKEGVPSERHTNYRDFDEFVKMQ